MNARGLLGSGPHAQQEQNARREAFEAYEDERRKARQRWEQIKASENRLHQSIRKDWPLPPITLSEQASTVAGAWEATAGERVE
jgi:hypothetical protein